MRALTVGVVFGGRSVEHDVSIVTAHQVMAALSERHKVVPIYVKKDGHWLTGSALEDLAVYRDGLADKAGTPCHLPPEPGAGLYLPGGRLKGPTRISLDAVVPCIHGTFGEDGTLQGLLELANLPYTCSGVTGSAVGMDKPVMKAAFADAGLPTVSHVTVEIAGEGGRKRAVQKAESAIGYPAFVKPSRLGSSVGIGRANDRSQLEQTLEVASRYDHRLLIEKAMDGCIEVNCSVLGGGGMRPVASVCEQPVAWEGHLTFEDKYMRSSKVSAKGMSGQQRLIPAPISDEVTALVQRNAIAAFDAVNASGVARVDAFVDEKTGETWVNEINTVPGSFAFYLWEATGMDFGDLMDKLLEIALAEHQLKSELMFTFDSGILDSFRGGKSGG